MGQTVHSFRVLPRARVASSLRMMYVHARPVAGKLPVSRSPGTPGRCSGVSLTACRTTTRRPAWPSSQAVQPSGPMQDLQPTGARTPATCAYCTCKPPKHASAWVGRGEGFPGRPTSSSASAGYSRPGEAPPAEARLVSTAPHVSGCGACRADATAIEAPRGRKVSMAPAHVSKEKVVAALSSPDASPETRSPGPRATSTAAVLGLV